MQGLRSESEKSVNIFSAWRPMFGVVSNWEHYGSSLAHP